MIFFISRPTVVIYPTNCFLSLNPHAVEKRRVDGSICISHGTISIFSWKAGLCVKFFFVVALGLINENQLYKANRSQKETLIYECFDRLKKSYISRKIGRTYLTVPKKKQVHPFHKIACTHLVEKFISRLAFTIGVKILIRHHSAARS